MKKIEIKTSYKKLLADVHTPVGIYLRLRDRFRDTILLESAESNAQENSFSFIGINAIAGIEIRDKALVEFKLPGKRPESIQIKGTKDVPVLLNEFLQRFEITFSTEKPVRASQGLFGYFSYDAVQFFESISLHKRDVAIPDIPMMRYRLYQYVIAIDHFKDELYLIENEIAGINSELELVESLIRNRDVPAFPFETNGKETSNLSDHEYVSMVKKGIEHCHRGDVFQIVLSRRFAQPFTGDEFNVYRALRSINPSPYLFYFDYGEYRLLGSSPESQLIVKNGKAVIHPIAGTYRRTGDEEKDASLAAELMNDTKENAEHVMLVDLARNDLSRHCDHVEVSKYKQIQYFSHVIHMVSEVTGQVFPNTNPFELLATSFPAGTLSGAPKYRAMEIIDSLEPTARSYYGGAIGIMGFDGSTNHAIMIRTFLSRNNTLFCQAGAGVVAASKPENELQEVNNKLSALKKAISFAETIAS
ncbi:MAG: anthranilate synthase component I family protein [Chitinophagaceae bacterium]